MIDTISFEEVKWYQVFNPAEEDFEWLMETFGFHPLDIEDCKSSNQRPKIDEYDDYYFLILHFPYFDKQNRFIRLKEVKIFWGRDYIVTVGSSHWVVKNTFNEMKRLSQIQPAKKKAEQEDDDNKLDITSSSDALLYNLLDRLMVETYSLILRIGTEVDNINFDIFNKKATIVLDHLSVTRKNLISLNTSFRPQLRVFHKFESGDIKGYEEDMEEYWGNILDQYQKMFDLVEDYGELIEGLSQTFDSLQTNKSNEIMKTLTIISTIMLPLTLVSGIYGMNVDLPGMTSPFAFAGIMGVMLLIGLSFYFYFRKKGLF
ncbi:MAG: magnesium transporter CorA family protein [Bacteroidales bacterium]|nr:magnesium transporter CorA family protein [Bacteroidales bacterium]